MNLFISFLQGKQGHPIPAYSFWEYYIKKGIEESGHQWSEANVDWALGLVEQEEAAFQRWKTEAWEITVKDIKNNRPDIFLSYLYPHQIDAAAINYIRSLGVPTVNFFCDNVREFQSVPERFGCFDLNWVPEQKALSMYVAARMPHIHLPMPMWVDPGMRTIAEREVRQVTFIGSRDVQRQLLFEEVLKHEPSFPLGIYGAAWKESTHQLHRPAQDERKSLRKVLANQLDFIQRNGIDGYYRKIRQRGNILSVSSSLMDRYRGKPSFDEYINLTKSSYVTLGVNRYPSFRFPLKKPDSYSRLRDIEAPMLGACYLTEWTDGIDNMFDTRNEILTYTSPKELIEKAGFLMSSKAERVKRRQLAQERALSDLSIPNSLKKLSEYFKKK